MSWLLLGARPRTLPAAVVPVVVACGLVAHDHSVIWWRAAMALVIALALQVGTNYANDYSDGIRGTDVDRVGPTRVVASGLAPAMAVKRAAFGAFGVAALAGLVLACAVGWWLVVVGAASIAAGWFYTGGRHPYGYLGLGELFVFVFFGLVAVMGTAYALTGEIGWYALGAGCAVGCLAVAILVVNNLRDISGDLAAEKRTLAVRLGDSRTRRFHGLVIVAAYVLALVLAVGRPWASLALFSLPFAVAAVRPVLQGATGRDLVVALGATARLELVFGVLVTIGLAL